MEILRIGDGYIQALVSLSYSQREIGYEGNKKRTEVSFVVVAMFKEVRDLTSTVEDEVCWLVVLYTSRTVERVSNSQQPLSGLRTVLEFRLKHILSIYWTTVLN